MVHDDTLAPLLTPACRAQVRVEAVTEGVLGRGSRDQGPDVRRTTVPDPASLFLPASPRRVAPGPQRQEGDRSWQSSGLCGGDVGAKGHGLS